MHAHELEPRPQPQSAPVAAAPAPPQLLLRLQQSAGNRAVGRYLARREFADASRLRGPQDWTTDDRKANTQRWQTACLTNLDNVDSAQYRKIVERRDFYKWFYNYTASRGYTTRWALAASVVADGAHQIADMDEDHAWANDGLGMANVELQGAMREGNQVIFDNVLPKLKRLKDGGAVTGRAALDWDMQVLAEEQTLIQPMYARMSQQTRDQLDYIARKKRFTWLGAKITGDDKVPAGPYNKGDTVPAFDQPDLQKIEDRWRYGMGLGKRFAPTDTGWDPVRDTMPGVGAGYSGGAEFARVDYRAALHKLDAWLNPNRLSRTGSGSDYKATIAALSDREKRELLLDDSPDGWMYSIAFAQFSFIDEATVRSALPTDPALKGVVELFVARWKAERDRIYMTTPDPGWGGLGF